MAEHGTDYTRGHMDIRQNEQSFHIFILMTKWGSLAVAVIVLAATLWFCTPAGFFGGLIPPVVVALAGVLLLREKPGDSHGH